MPLKTKPLNNNALIEVQREYDGVSRADIDENLQYGLLLDYSLNQYHITASAAIGFDVTFLDDLDEHLKALIDKTVRWEQFAEGGQTFIEDGKTYALIPWWRLISVTETEDDA